MADPAPATLRPVRKVSEREMALALVLELAESGRPSFSLLGFYDNDAGFVDDLARRLNVDADDKAYLNKLTKVVRTLARHNALLAEMRGTHKYYIGEPAKQMEYSLPVGKAALLTRGQTEFTMTPEGEAAFLIRRAYPAPETD